MLIYKLRDENFSVKGNRYKDTHTHNQEVFCISNHGYTTALIMMVFHFLSDNYAVALVVQDELSN